MSEHVLFPFFIERWLKSRYLKQLSFRHYTKSWWAGGVGLQQDRGSHIRQLSNTRCSELKNFQRFQNTPRIFIANIQLWTLKDLSKNSGSGNIRRTLRPKRSENQFCQGLGPKLLKTIHRLLPLLAGDFTSSSKITDMWFLNSMLNVPAFGAGVRPKKEGAKWCQQPQEQADVPPSIQLGQIRRISYRFLLLETENLAFIVI